MTRVLNASGHEVKVGSLLAYHADRLIEAIRLALANEFAEVLAVEHAVEAVRAWRAK